MSALVQRRRTCVSLGNPFPPVLVSGSGASNGSGGSSLTVTAPTNISSGNLLWFFGGWDSHSGNPTLPSGFSLVGSLYRGGSFDTVFVATKTATGSEPGSYAFTMGGVWAAGVMLNFGQSSQGQAPVLDVSPVFNHGENSSQAVISSASATGADIWVGAVYDGSAGTTYSTPTGFTTGPNGHGSFGSCYSFTKSVVRGGTGTATSTAGATTNWNSVSSLIGA